VKDERCENDVRGMRRSSFTFAPSKGFTSR
jgi:hypothetical protein